MIPSPEDGGYLPQFWVKEYPWGFENLTLFRTKITLKIPTMCRTTPIFKTFYLDTENNSPKIDLLLTDNLLN